MADEKKGGYGKSGMPLWAWILVYVVIGGLLYWWVYAAYLAPKSNSSAGSNDGGSPSSLYSY